MKHLDLFSGIGGFSLAASWVWGDEHEIHSFVEIDEFCQKVLKKHWPNVPIHSDIKDYNHDGTVITLLTGGYPCQAFSKAAHGNNIAEDFTPRMFQIIKNIQPKFVIAENVEENTIRIFKQRLQDVGYSAFYRCNDAAYAGADHQRNRWFCIAHANGNGELQSKVDGKTPMLPSISKNTWGWRNYAGTFRVFNGVSNRMDRLRALGNAIVPQVVVPIMQAIKQIEEMK